MTKKKWTKVLISIILFFLFILPPIFSSNKAQSIIEAEPQQVKSIKLAPFKDVKLKDLVSDIVEIKEIDIIHLICEALNESYNYTPVHPRKIWNCVLTLVKEDGEYTCLIAKTENGEVLIQIEWGWHFRELRSDKIGMILEQYLNNAKINPGQKKSNKA